MSLIHVSRSSIGLETERSRPYWHNVSTLFSDPPSEQKLSTNPQFRFIMKMVIDRRPKMYMRTWRDPTSATWSGRLWVRTILILTRLAVLTQKNKINQGDEQPPTASARNHAFCEYPRRYRESTRQDCIPRLRGCLKLFRFPSRSPDNEAKYQTDGECNDDVEEEEHPVFLSRAPSG